MLKETLGIGTHFIGRKPELDVLRTALAEMLAGRGRTVLLSGEPGIGKTRLATELAADAERQSAQVLLGRCYEGEGAPPFWPWVQIVRAYISTCDTETLRAEMGAGAADIAQAIPEVHDHLPALPASSGLDSEQARFRLFDSVTTFLQTAARRQPLVLILDDLHWADTPSLRLLQFVAREIAAVPLLIVGTYRDLRLGRDHPLSQAIGELVRTPGSQSLSLPGLSVADVAQFLAHTHLQPSEALVGAIHQQTEGNPFFLTELVQLMEREPVHSLAAHSHSPASFPIPQSVQAAIGRRLQPLSVGCQQLLQLAAVLGREFSLETLEALGQQFAVPSSGDRLLDVLEEAVAARLIGESPPVIGRYRFVHAVIRETLYEELSAPRRVRFHQQIAAVLEARYVAKQDSWSAAHAREMVAELAFHFFHTAQGGQETAKAVAYARQAGEQAMVMLAYEEAVRHYERALQALAFSGTQEDSQYGELLLALGEAQMRAGALPKAREAFQRAAVLARTLHARGAREHGAQLFARAALGFIGWAFTTADPPSLALLEEALTLLGEEDSSFRAQVLSRLAAALYYLPQETERRLALSRQAVDMARRLGDTATLATVLISHRWVLWNPDSLSERIAISQEVVRLAEATASHEVALRGWLWLCSDEMENGNIVEAERCLSPIVHLSATLRQPFWQWWPHVYRAVFAFLRGHFTEAEQQIRRAWALGQRVQPAFAVRYFWCYLLPILHEQQRLPEVETELQVFLTQFAQVPSWRIVSVWLASALGREAEAREGFAMLAAHDFADLPKDGNWHGNMAALCEICLVLSDARHAAILYTLWRPYAGRNTIGGASAAQCRGAVSRYLGALATLLSRWDAAEQYFHDALAMNTRMGARPWVAYTQYDYATMLLRRNQPGDHDKALSLLDTALATANELGMARLRSQVQSLQPTVQTEHGHGSAMQVRRNGERGFPRPPVGERDRVRGEEREASLDTPSPQPSPAERERERNEHPIPNLLRRTGDYWTLVYNGQECRLKDAKGLHYLAALLQHPHREFHVLDLLLLTDPPPATTAAKAELSSARRMMREPDDSPQADTQARAAYKSRLQEVRAELEEADRLHDLGRIAALQAEQTFLTDELTAAYGFRRHARTASDGHEQIRKNVTKRIRESVGRVQREHPALGHHLQHALKTGTFCSYTPERNITWEG
jgi:tetratricopeptide (TPR) repeat protein